MRAIDIAIGQILGYVLAGLLVLAAASFITGINFFSLVGSLLSLMKRFFKKIAS